MVAYYRDRGYIEARVGQPELKILEDSKDSKTRFVELRIPMTEGQQYRDRKDRIRRQQDRERDRAASAVQD